MPEARAPGRPRAQLPEVDTDTDRRVGRAHHARKELFTRALRAGTLTLQEVDRALPPGTLSDAERWLFHASLRAAGIALVDERTGVTDLGGHPGGGV